MFMTLLSILIREARFLWQIEFMQVFSIMRHNISFHGPRSHRIRIIMSGFRIRQALSVICEWEIYEWDNFGSKYFFSLLFLKKGFSSSNFELLIKISFSIRINKNNITILNFLFNLYLSSIFLNNKHLNNINLNIFQGNWINFDRMFNMYLN